MSIEHELPDLIRTYLGSVWDLEVLLVLRRSPNAAWTTESLTMELRASAPIAASAIERFLRVGFITSKGDGSYRYAPQSHLQEAFGDAIERLYQERPVSVINLIVAPEDRIQQLADAFRFKSASRRAAKGDPC